MIKFQSRLDYISDKITGRLGIQTFIGGYVFHLLLTRHTAKKTILWHSNLVVR